LPAHSTECAICPEFCLVRAQAIDGPSIISINATYADLGAQITGPQPDLNLGITTLLDGATTTQPTLDTEMPGNLCDWLPLRPLLAGLPRTIVRIGLLEMHARQAQSMSVNALATIAAIQILAGVFNFGAWILAPRPNAYLLISAAFLGLMGAYFLAMLMAKLRAQHAAA
jgi:hypothetical protein